MNRTPDEIPAAVLRSGTFAAAEVVRATVMAGVDGARVTATLRRLVRAWSQSAWVERRFNAGLALVVAAAVHVALIAVFGTASSWIVFIIPIAVALAGALALASSAAAGIKRS